MYSKAESAWQSRLFEGGKGGELPYASLICNGNVITPQLFRQAPTEQQNAALELIYNGI